MDDSASTQQRNVADSRAGRERPERIGPNIRTWLNWGNEDSRTCHWRGPLLSVCIMAMLFASQMLLSSASRWALIAFPVFGPRGLGTWVLIAVVAILILDREWRGLRDELAGGSV